MYVCKLFSILQISVIFCVLAASGKYNFNSLSAIFGGFCGKKFKSKIAFFQISGYLQNSTRALSFLKIAVKKINR